MYCALWVVEQYPWSVPTTHQQYPQPDLHIRVQEIISSHCQISPMGLGAGIPTGGMELTLAKDLK